ncbi:carboxypeptidase-like regulatory domain-containing protein [Hymenobacter psoromatis]|uniref:carboxypeptidase-like regulatory domain-containing protein n=1 Tax=Hymenobacter psoromatis TaxID=1484116 RepID=UPI001CBD4277|nr:carboxypeptidase-like regulatory domain-containing protein [Hymenobacter psoromatis]
MTEGATPQLVQLRGIVLRSDGQPYAGASVYLAGAPRQLVVTDAKGAFALPVPAGTALSLRVEYFDEGSSHVELPAPSREPLRIILGCC